MSDTRDPYANRNGLDRSLKHDGMTAVGDSVHMRKMDKKRDIPKRRNPNTVGDTQPDQNNTTKFDQRQGIGIISGSTNVIDDKCGRTDLDLSYAAQKL